MPYYKITCPESGLPEGKIVKTVSKYPYEDGEQLICQINDRITVGYWHPNKAGHNWIRQRSRLIPVIGKVVVDIIGVIVSDKDKE